MTPAEYSKFLLALVIYREARGEGEVGMIAVAHVIANRCFTWGKSYHDVILGQNQFSSMSVPNDPELHVWPALGDPVFDIAEAAYSGFSKDPTGGALYYANESVVTSGWYQRNVMDNPEHPVLVVLGRHTFRK
jgi:N-acetylmuramoyl-L-alanine amidase